MVREMFPWGSSGLQMCYLWMNPGRAEIICWAPAVPVAKIKRCWQNRQKKGGWWWGEGGGDRASQQHVKTWHLCHVVSQSNWVRNRLLKQRFRRIIKCHGGNYKIGDVKVHTVHAKNNHRVVCVRGRWLKGEDKASGWQVPLRGEKKLPSKLYHYALNFEKFHHAGSYHLRWQHTVRNNSPRRNLWLPRPGEKK